MWRFLCAVSVLLAMVSVPKAQENSEQNRALEFLDRLPESTMRKLRKGPDYFIEQAAGLILGYGENGRIDQHGIDLYIASRFAEVRAREIRKFLKGDLNDDLQLSELELSVQINAASARQRGRLLLDFRAADINQDGVLTFDEMRSYAQTRADAGLGQWQLADLKALMEFDTNDDGFVSLDEVVVTARALIL